MKVEGSGIVINIKKVQEKFALLFVFSREHGLVKGLVRNSTSKKSYKPGKGDFVKFAKSTRLADHLGLFQIELLKSPAVYFMTERYKLGLVEVVLAQISHFFHEGDVAKQVYEKLDNFISVLSSDEKVKVVSEFIKFELFLLAEIGYGLDFSKCAATGSVEDLCYISPKSGCAVSKSAGEPYKNKLFQIPEFLKTGENLSSDEEINTSFNMIEYFFKKADIDIFEKIKLDRSALYIVGQAIKKAA